jgi:hypothetical protein
MRHCVFFSVLLLSANAAIGQAPFELDTTFRAEFQTWYVASALPVEDDRVIISGQVKFDGDIYFRTGALLNSDGTRNLAFPDVAFMGGKLTRLNDRIYSGNGQIVRRQFMDGTLDESFILMNDDPYFNSLQGGDYHVFPDGRVVMSGMHMLNDPVRGFVGDYNFIWFSNQGYLDTTRTHRSGNGALYDFIELPDGKFIADYNGTVYDGRPTSGIQRMHADGSLDTTFNVGATYAQVGGFLPTSGDRVYVGGSMIITGEADTLNLVRLLPDGSLDPAFNNHLDLGLVELTGLDGVISGIYPFDGDKLIVVGGFETIDGQPRNSIAVLDTNGVLLPIGVGTGCGSYVHQGFTYGSFQGLVPCGVDSFYIYGAYHGYDDGVVNDGAQRFISRLVGPYLEVGIDANIAAGPQPWSLHPNPAQTTVTIDCAACTGPAQFVIRDAIGRAVQQASVLSGTVLVGLEAISSGSYTLELWEQGRSLGVKRLIVQP